MATIPGSPEVSGQGTTYGLPNFVGPLFQASPTATPLLTMIGGLGGYEPCTSETFQWQGVDLRDSQPNRSRLEGAAAPTAGNARRPS